MELMNGVSLLFYNFVNHKHCYVHNEEKVIQQIRQERDF